MHQCLTLYRTIGLDVVELLVRSEAKKITVYKSLICVSSEFFNEAFNGNSREAQDSTMNLSEDDYCTVCVLVQRLYAKKLPGDVASELEDPITLYLCCGQNCSTTIKDFVMDAI